MALSSQRRTQCRRTVLEAKVHETVVLEKEKKEKKRKNKNLKWDETCEVL